MPTAKTESTELSVGFGLLNSDPLLVKEEELNKFFEGSLAIDKYRDYKREYSANQGLYRQFFNLGLELRNLYPLYNALQHLTWSGPQQQAATTSASKDLIAANIPISVKNESNVVLNPSPYNLFITIPSGQMTASNAENWYYTADQQGIGKLYKHVREKSGLELPTEYLEFEQSVRRDQRKELQRAIGQFSGAVRTEFQTNYQDMCRKVAEYSAQKFNENYLAASSTNRRGSLGENLIKQFFRINSVTYILAGVDRRRVFALEIPDLTQWKQNWRLVEVEARPDLTRSQSVVMIGMTLEKKNPKTRFTMNYRVEIRWSHGKFCGNPEAKLYKEFAWADVPFFKNIIG